MQPPSQGRVVLFTYHPGTDDSVATAPAIITEVHNATAVGLYVMSPTSAWHEHSAFYADEPGKSAGSWAWPPRVKVAASPGESGGF